MGKEPLYPHRPKSRFKIGYRRGAVGEYTGGNPREASIAWKAMDYEYREIGNEHILTDMARFLGIPARSWSVVLDEFKRRYGDSKGIWLTSTKRASLLYKEYGELEEIPYNPKDVVTPDGGDGFYVLDRR